MSPISIADQSPSVEFFTVNDWETILSNRNSLGLSFLSSSRAPYLEHAYSLPVPVVWGFSVEGMVPKLLNIIDDLQVFSELETVLNIQHAQQEFFSRWVNVLALGGTKLSLKEILQTLRKEIPNTFPLSKCDIDLERILNSIAENYSGRWMKFDKMLFFYLYAESGEQNYERDSQETEVRTFLTYVYDATILRDSVKFNIPWERIAKYGQLKPTCYEHIFFDPQEFCVWKEPARGQFLWPWQRCMAVSPTSREKLSLTAINTTSLVGDLRFSTVAMNQFWPPEAYASFLDEIVEISHKLLLSSGAYFDKETGDGFAAHYCTSEFEIDEFGANAQANEIETAISTGRQIILAASEICQKYQKHLKQGLQNVQMSIGIHSENAVWICDRNQVRALGQSVVQASRLCDTAKPMETIISNSCYQVLLMSGSPLIADFIRRDIDIKEIHQKAGSYGYGIGPAT